MMLERLFVRQEQVIPIEDNFIVEPEFSISNSVVLILGNYFEPNLLIVIQRRVL